MKKSSKLSLKGRVLTTSLIDRRQIPMYTLSLTQVLVSFQQSSVEMIHSQQIKCKIRDPSYPTSFAALAALIASGAPIPGIKQIPEKLNEVEASKPKVAQVPGAGRKPWEREDSLETSITASTSESPLNSKGEYMVFGYICRSFHLTLSHYLNKVPQLRVLVLFHLISISAHLADSIDMEATTSYYRKKSRKYIKGHVRRFARKS